MSAWDLIKGRLRYAGLNPDDFMLEPVQVHVEETDQVVDAGPDRYYLTEIIAGEPMTFESEVGYIDTTDYIQSGKTSDLLIELRGRIRIRKQTSERRLISFVRAIQFQQNEHAD